MDDRKDLMELIRDKYRRCEKFEFEHRLELPDGSEKYFLARGEVITDDNGAAIKMIGTGQDITDLKATENQLRSYSERLRQLTEKKEQIREKERVRIARKLHDELGQLLSVLKLDLYSMMSSPSNGLNDKQKENGEKTRDLFTDIKRDIHTAIDIVDKITQSVKRISTELRPPSLDECDLADAIEEELKEFKERTGSRTTFSNQTESLSDLTEKESTAMFRIFQEALTNIIRHANASHVRVELTEKDENIILKVIDNGVGLEPGNLDNSGSLGILGMKERSEYLGGDIQFLSGAYGEQGTAVIVTIPRIRYRNKKV
jgi:signal transduction histidine kinase